MTKVETADQTCDGRDKNKLHSIYPGVPGGCDGHAKVQAAATGTLSAAERSYPPRPRAGAVAESARLRRRRNGREELPHVRGQGQRPEELPTEVRGGGREEIPHALKPKARGGGQEDQTHAVAVRAQEGLAELSHVEGQEGRW